MILVSHIKCSLIHGRKPICYRQAASCAQLKSTVPVIATIRIRIECPIAGQEIQVSTAIRRRCAAAHPDPAARVSKRSIEIRRRVEYRIGSLDESGSSITNDPAVVWILVLMRGPSDPTTQTLYVVSKSVIPSGPTFFQRLHAIDLTTGNEKFSGPVTISASVPGTADGSTTVTFSPQQENQRPGLALVNDVVYIAWASHEDHERLNPFLSYHGWVIGYTASTLAQAPNAVFNS